MSPVNRAGSVSEISPRHPFLCKNTDVFIWEAGLAPGGGGGGGTPANLG